MYLKNLWNYEWELTKSPAGAKAVDAQGRRRRRHRAGCARSKSKRHAPMMFTTDIALKMDPEYAKITKRWLENPKEFADAFAKAWYKLTHRDMGPHARYLGPEVPPKPSSGRTPSRPSITSSSTPTTSSR